jgi:hypothetical protein
MLFHLVLEKKTKMHSEYQLPVFFSTKLLLSERALKLYHSSVLLYTEVPYGGKQISMPKGIYVAN